MRADLRPGTVLGRYELLREVGRGGMGTVWAARQRGAHGFNKVVALKAMLPAASDDARFASYQDKLGTAQTSGGVAASRFRAEATLVSGIEHANVCRVLDLGEDDGILFLALEWVDGASLAVLVRASGGRLPLGAVVSIARDVARGLQAAHDARDADGKALGIVHRDVSPQNVLVGLDGVARIADFGIARASGDAGGKTQPGYVEGKVRYLAPEQVYDEEVDARTDVFALGVVLYEASTGVHPFAAATDVGTLARIADGEPAVSPTTLVDGYLPSLAAVITRSIAKAPDERHASMGELAAALSEVLRSLDGGGPEDVAALVRGAVGSRGAMQGESVRSLVTTAPALRRRRLAVAALASCAGLAALGAAFWPHGVAPIPASIVSTPALPVAVAAETATQVAQAELAPLPVTAPSPAPVPQPSPSRSSPHPRSPAGAAPARASPPASVGAPADHDELRTRE